MILGPTILGELAVFTNAFQNLSPIQLLGTGIIGYLSADLIVGLYHFAMDKVDWTSQAVPYQIKRSAIYFNLHQDVPSDCARFSYWDLTRASYLTNLKILTISRVLSLLGYPLPSFFLAVTNLIATQRQFFHALAHRNPTQNNGFIKFLQNNHIILNPQFHNKHHIPPYESHFCILTGHMNGVLDSMINAGRRIHGFFANNTKQD